MKLNIISPWVDITVTKPPVNHEVWFCDYDGVFLSFRGHLNEQGMIANENGVMNTVDRLGIIAWMPIPSLTMFANKKIMPKIVPAKWISVKEKLPGIEKHVLLTNSDGWIKVGYWDGNEWWWADGYPVGRRADNGDISYSSYCVITDVIAWMPIPELPQINGK